jgi:hypothetical protein
MRTIAIALGLAGRLVVAVPVAAVDRIVDDQLGSGSNDLSGNHCATQLPPGAFD